MPSQDGDSDMKRKTRRPFYPLLTSLCFPFSMPFFFTFGLGSQCHPLEPVPVLVQVPRQVGFTIVIALEGLTCIHTRKDECGQLLMGPSSMLILIFPALLLFFVGTLLLCVTPLFLLSATNTHTIRTP